MTWFEILYGLPAAAFVTNLIYLAIRVATMRWQNKHR